MQYRVKGKSLYIVQGNKEQKIKDIDTSNLLKELKDIDKEVLTKAIQIDVLPTEEPKKKRAPRKKKDAVQS